MLSSPAGGTILLTKQDHVPANGGTNLKNLVSIVMRAALAGAVSAVGMGAVSASSALAAPSFFPPPGQAAVFVQKYPASNQIVAYERAPNGASAILRRTIPEGTVPPRRVRRLTRSLLKALSLLANDGRAL